MKKSLLVLLIAVFSVASLASLRNSLLAREQARHNEPGVFIQVQLIPEGAAPVDSGLRDRTSQVLQKRLERKGTRPAVVTSPSNDRLDIQIPGISELDEAIELVSTVGRLEFRENVSVDSTVRWETAIDGSQVAQALAQRGTGDQGWEVLLELTPAGKQMLEKLTSRNIGKPLGVFLDGRELMAPIVQAPISDGHALITGFKGYEGPHRKQVSGPQEASELAAFLNGGQLPTKLAVLESHRTPANKAAQPTPGT